MRVQGTGGFNRTSGRNFKAGKKGDNADDKLNGKHRRGNIEYHIKCGTASRGSRMQVESTLTIGRKVNPHDSNTKDLEKEAHSTDSRKDDKKKHLDDNKIDTLEDENTIKNEEKEDTSESTQLNVWFHERRTSEEDVLIPSTTIPGLKVGDICQLVPAENDDKESYGRELIFVVNENTIIEKETKATSHSAVSIPNTASGSNALKGKVNFQISLISSPLQGLLDLAPRSSVYLRIIGDYSDVVADTVEIAIRDINLTRDSMWKFSSKLVGSGIYIDKRVTFADSRIGFVSLIYKNGKNATSAYVSDKTKIVFRSRSAKIVFLIQLSLEMWHFEETGEIMFHKLVNALFPKIFKKWRDKDTHHSISIVLFTSVDVTKVPWNSLGHGERPSNRRDYFRVVVDQISTLFWDRIMEILRLEFANFKRDILLNKNTKAGGTYLVQGKTLISSKGNVLEAINLLLQSLSDRFRTTDLKHTVNNFILITPGTGLFDVEYDLMYNTSRKMLESDVGLDIISLSQPPLHQVPLFRFKDKKDGKLVQCVPHWCDISFYTDKSNSSFQWMPRCKMYELQMMGVMEKEASNIAVGRLNIKSHSKTIIESMNAYDELVFNTSLEGEQDNDSSYRKHQKEDEEKQSSKPLLPHSSLQLIWNKDKDSTRAISSGTTTDVVASNLSALGTVTSMSYQTSALSTLYGINRASEGIQSRTTSSGGVETISSLENVRSQGSIGKNKNSLAERDIRSKLPRIFTARNTNNKEHDDLLVVRKETSPDKIAKLNKSPIVPSSSDLFLEDDYYLLWTKLENPSKTLDLDLKNFNNQSRWQDVFPPGVKSSLIKKKSYEAPASLPITTSNFPTSRQLEAEFNFQVYTVLLNPENELEIRSTEDLMREMIQLRLLLGFQICCGEKVEKFESTLGKDVAPGTLLKYLRDKGCYGTKIYLSSINEIHRIYCDFSGNLFVQSYRKIEKKEKGSFLGEARDVMRQYRPLIRTRYSEEYSPLQIENVLDIFKSYNWNQFDQYLAGYDDVMPPEKKIFYRMKFVVLPSDIPKNAFFISNENLSDEEIRVEGLRKLIAMIERGKYTKPGEKRHRRKEEILPEISFYTGNLYQFLSELMEGEEIGGLNHTNIPEHPKFSKDIKLAQLAQELQGPNGLNLVDRIWHFKKHRRCFLGNELVSWLIEYFEDIDHRDEATKYGQSLMEKGLFRHVEQRHNFLDGYYFYEFESDYVHVLARADKAGPSWFGRRKNQDRLGNSTESSPFTKNNSDGDSLISPIISTNDSYDQKLGASASSNQNLEATYGESLANNPSQVKKFVLSKAVRFDVDPTKKSYRPEVVTVHYDKVHNPEHCFHIRIEWLNTTNKFIDEIITNWSRLCERHGLKLVETPWIELCQIPRINPFHSFVDIKLVLDPWEDEEFKSCRILEENRFFFHLYLLKESDFYLDNRSSLFFLKENIEISYSWGMPSFQFAQYIHKTGFYIVELRENGGFFLAPNNVHIKRNNSSINYISDVECLKDNASRFASEKVMLNFRATCTDEIHLRTIFQKAKTQWEEDSLSKALLNEV